MLGQRTRPTVRQSELIGLETKAHSSSQQQSNILGIPSISSNLKASFTLWKSQVLAWTSLAATESVTSCSPPQGAPEELEKQQQNGNMKSKDENYSH